MLAIVVRVVEERYALAAKRVVEVVPRVSLSRVPRSPAWHAGLLAYRGAAVPVIDLNRRLLDADCPPQLGNRVLVIEHTRKHSNQAQRWGLLVEQVLEVRSIPDELTAGAENIRASGAQVASLSDGELLQMLDLDAVIGEGMALALGDGRYGDAR